MTSRRLSQRQFQAYLPSAALALMVVAIYVIPATTGTSTQTGNIYNVFQYFSSVGLLALGLSLTMIAGEFDLSTAGSYVLGGMVAVKTGESSPVLGVAAAVGAGAVTGLIQGGIIAKLNLNSLPVTLGGYITLLGLTATISSSVSVPYENFDAGLRLDEPILNVFSLRSLIALALFVAVICALRYTRLGRDLRAVGGDRRASRIVGVRVDRVLISVFVTSGALAALGGAMLAYSISTAVPDLGLAPLIFAASAALLGGIALTGGMGSIAGVAAAALALSLLQELFAIQSTAEYVSNITTGLVLTIVAAATAPQLRAGWRSLRPRKVRAEQARPAASR